MKFRFRLIISGALPERIVMTVCLASLQVEFENDLMKDKRSTLTTLLLNLMEQKQERQVTIISLTSFNLQIIGPFVILRP